MAGFPVIVLLLVQINALRYQSGFINGVQRVWLISDLLAIVAFFFRNPLNGRALGRKSWFAAASHLAALSGLPALIMYLNMSWLNVVTYQEINLVRSPEWSKAINQPLDYALCPLLKWGCRYLRVEHRTLVDHVRDDKVMGMLRTVGVDHAAALSGIEGVVLRERNIRFAILYESRLYGECHSAC